jgi:hypothetical protein
MPSGTEQDEMTAKLRETAAKGPDAILSTVVGGIASRFTQVTLI